MGGTWETCTYGPLTKDDCLFFQYMGFIENPQSPESRVNDFAAFFLHILNYDKDHIIAVEIEPEAASSPKKMSPRQAYLYFPSGPLADSRSNRVR